MNNFNSSNLNLIGSHCLLHGLKSIVQNANFDETFLRGIGH